MMNRCTLLIDGNWLLMSRLSIMSDRFDKTANDAVSIENGKLALMDLLAQSINKVIVSLPVIDNILYVQDYGSWRKSLPNPTPFAYKGNRVYDEDKLDWDAIWDTNDRFAAALRSNGITTVREYEVEGDDWIAFWSRKLNSEGVNTVIWSTDRDLQQLVSNDRSTGRWTAWYNSKVLVLDKDLDDTRLDPVDFFLRFDERDPILTTLCDNVRHIEQDIQYINPCGVVVSKILCGDASDNIKSIAHTDAGNRSIELTERDVSKGIITEEYTDLEKFFYDTPNLIDRVVECRKFAKYNLDCNKVYEWFEFNKALVWLDESVYPPDVCERIHAHENDYSITDIAYIRNNYKTLLGEWNDAAERNAIRDLYNSI